MRRDALVPNPLISDRQYHCFHHLDICELGDMELTDELYALRPLLWGLPEDHWLRERVHRLEGEIAKRDLNMKYRTSIRPKPKPAEGVTL